MSCFNFLTGIASKPSADDFGSISFHSQLNPFPRPGNSPSTRSGCSRFSKLYPPRSGLREIRDRIETVKSIHKVTEAMKLVAAARVRRAQEAAVNSRPFAETLAGVLHDINEQCRLDDVEVPLTEVRPVKRVAIVVIAGDRGLCGGFNSLVLKKAESRVKELRSLGLESTLISVRKKANSYFQRRPGISVESFVRVEGFPTSKEAQVIADKVFSLFLSEEVDKVELLYTKFVSLIKSDPVIHNLLPLGRVWDANGKAVDATDDEFFRLTTKEGKLAIKREPVLGLGMERSSKFLPNLEFEQDPAQILDALMPLYLNSQILKALQESYASELAARMNAMTNATDNAVELKQTLSVAYNRQRQAKITGELLEIVAGAEALMHPNS